MNKNILFLTAFLISVRCSSQILSGTNPATQLPAPKVKLVTPADLQVTSISLVSCTKDAASKRLIISVSVTVKNNGQLKAESSKLQACFQTSSAASGIISRAIDGLVTVAAVNPGSSVTAEYVFRRPFSGDAGFNLVTFDFWVKADAGNAVRESDETNNSSSTIRITPPAH